MVAAMHSFILISLNVAYMCKRYEPAVCLLQEMNIELLDFETIVKLKSTRQQAREHNKLWRKMEKWK